MLKTVLTKRTWLLLVLLMPWHSLLAENRLALVIGNGNYPDAKLSNPYNDANDMATVLEELEFDVILQTNIDRRKMARSIREFGRRLKKNGGVGLFYYAGHGMQLANRNYLIPVDAPMQEEDEVPYESIDVNSVLAKMQSAGNALNLLILDACRNNPFPNRFRSASRGLARVEAPVGSLVVYATAPGNVAADGTGRNGTFTGHLIEQLRTKGLSLTQTIRRTRAAVVKETEGRQVPWESSSLLEDYYLSPEVKQPEEKMKPPTTENANTVDQLDVLFWTSVQDGGTSVEYQAYLDRFPDGIFAALATERLKETRQPGEKPTELTEPPAKKVAALSRTELIQPSEKIADTEENLTEKSATTTGNTQASTEADTQAPAETNTQAPAEAETQTPTETNTQAPSEAATQTPTETHTQAPAEIKVSTKQSQDKRIEPSEEKSDSKLSSLTITVVPEDARIRIMNIVEKYRPGIQLDPAKEYDVYVTRDGFDSWRQNVMLSSRENSIDITLKERAIAYPKIVRIAGGGYRMGCSSGDKLCENYEKPSHNVTVAPFGLTQTEITVGQFRSFVSRTSFVTDAEKNIGGLVGCYIWSESGGISRSNAGWNWKKGKSWRDPGYQQSDKHPVTCVSWNDANAYAEWLQSTTGKLYRLPTEAEWELAARAGATTRYDYGNSPDNLCRHANGADKTNSPKGSKWSGRMKCSDKHWFSAPVATYRPNRLGIYDMQGNVWEWVSDSWSSNYKNTPVDGRAHTGNSGDQRVLRGGAWDGNSKMLRVSSRSKGGRNSRAAMTGFRLAVP